MTYAPDTLKVVQLVAAERGWHVKEHNPERGTWYSQEVACWALMSDGNVLPMVAGEGCELQPLNPHSMKLSLYSPTQSWKYSVSDAKPEDEDWEFVAALDETMLWRAPT